MVRAGQLLSAFAALAAGFWHSPFTGLFGMLGMFIFNGWWLYLSRDKQGG
ncbi:MAG: hypothetical protein JWL59_2640 [Chthoniobacteraceae bacterium]|nr:hypothetical protein [Chthoniobacteraceae bacterium]